MLFALDHTKAVRNAEDEYTVVGMWKWVEMAQGGHWGHQHDHAETRQMIYKSPLFFPQWPPLLLTLNSFLRHAQPSCWDSIWNVNNDFPLTDTAQPAELNQPSSFFLLYIPAYVVSCVSILNSCLFRLTSASRPFRQFELHIHLRIDSHHLYQLYNNGVTTVVSWDLIRYLFHLNVYFFNFPKDSLEQRFDEARQETSY